MAESDELSEPAPGGTEGAAGRRSSTSPLPTVGGGLFLGCADDEIVVPAPGAVVIATSNGLIEIPTEASPRPDPSILLVGLR
jgi:hypothetical protein